VQRYGFSLTTLADALRMVELQPAHRQLYPTWLAIRRAIEGGSGRRRRFGDRGDCSQSSRTWRLIRHSGLGAGRGGRRRDDHPIVLVSFKSKDGAMLEGPSIHDLPFRVEA
jgi:hypothetical protein